MVYSINALTMIRVTLACIFTVAVSYATAVNLSESFVRHEPHQITASLNASELSLSFSNEFFAPRPRLHNVALRAFLNALNLTTRLNALQDVSFTWPHNCSIQVHGRFDFDCQYNRNAMGPNCRGKNAPIQMAASCQVS